MPSFGPAQLPSRHLDAHGFTRSTFRSRSPERGSGRARHCLGPVTGDASAGRLGRSVPTSLPGTDRVIGKRTWRPGLPVGSRPSLRTPARLARRGLARAPAGTVRKGPDPAAVSAVGSALRRFRAQAGAGFCLASAMRPRAQRRDLPNMPPSLRSDSGAPCRTLLR